MTEQDFTLQRTEKMLLPCGFTFNSPKLAQQQGLAPRRIDKRFLPAV